MQISSVFVSSRFCYRSRASWRLQAPPRTSSSRRSSTLTSRRCCDTLNPLRCVMGCCTSAMLRDQGGPEAWRRGSKQWNNKFSSARGWWNVDSTPTTWWSRSSPTTTNWMPTTLGRPSSSFMRKSSTPKPRSTTCKTKTVSMNTDSKGWVWLQIWGSRRLDHPSMMVSLCLGRRTASLNHQQLHHHHFRRERHKHMGMGTPLGNCQAWGRCPGIVSPSHLYLYCFFLVRSFWLYLDLVE